MSVKDTAHALSAITDASQFERLATAVLREAEPAYKSLLHTGVNAEGKTVKAPVDGITIIGLGKARHFVAAHHTTCTKDDLEKKWLFDPATVKPRKAGSRPAPAGDVLKTLELFSAEKVADPDLMGTLILTTNEEPDDALVRRVSAYGNDAGLTIDIWSRSRIAHYLDHNPSGQWIRRNELGIDQERLSPELLGELSRKSCELFAPPGDHTSWISRDLDNALIDLSGRDLTFLVAPSGLGKSVACYKRLVAHIDKGGFGIILPHEIIATSASLDQAIEKALREMQASLVVGAGNEARALCTEASPLYIVVEDINKSSQPAILLEKVSSWRRSGDNKKGGSSVKLICPTWPQTIALLSDDVRKRIEANCIFAGQFTQSEGGAAVGARYSALNQNITLLEAEDISASLGNDPLLIALHDPADTPTPEAVLNQYVEGALRRAYQTRGEFSATQYRDALRMLSSKMLEQGQLTPSWQDIQNWFSDTTIKDRLLHLLHQQQIMQLSGDSSNENVRFRHDRVRDAILIEAIVKDIAENSISDQTIADPYYASILGVALAMAYPSQKIVDRCAAQNPIALFCALRSFKEPKNESHQLIIQKIEEWLASPDTHAAGNSYLRWHILRVLSEFESSLVRPLVAQFKESTDWAALSARLRNGDAWGGIDLCLQLEPGTRVVGHDELLDHVRRKHTDKVVIELASALEDVNSSENVRVGALRLAGHMRDARIGDAIAKSFEMDVARDEHLADYLWAAAQCCGHQPEFLLDPICAAWGNLPDEAEEKGMPSPRDNLASHNVRWAFHRYLPDPALCYFIERADGPDLNWQIIYMLHLLDHPEAVAFIAEELARTDERLEGTGNHSTFVISAASDWRLRRDGRPMSFASRSRLIDIWSDVNNGKHLRKQAFRLWSATRFEGAIEVLRTIDKADLLFDAALWQRLLRGDNDAIPDLLEKLARSENGAWWQVAKHVYSDSLVEALDAKFECRGKTAKLDWNEENEADDWATYEVVMRLPTDVAEQLLIKHWNHLQFKGHFVQTALFVATPKLLELVAATIESCPNPNELFKYIDMHMGIKNNGHPGITRIAQMNALVPYFSHVSDMSLHSFWELCNSRGWIDLRKKHIDPFISAESRYKQFLDKDCAITELNKTAREHPHWTDHWVDRHLEAGTSLDYVMTMIGQWAKDRNDLNSLQAAAFAVTHKGQRKHLAILDGVATNAPSALAEVSNATFAVKYRSLQ